MSNIFARFNQICIFSTDFHMSS